MVHQSSKVPHKSPRQQWWLPTPCRLESLMPVRLKVNRPSLSRISGFSEGERDPLRTQAAKTAGFEGGSILKDRGVLQWRRVSCEQQLDYSVEEISVFQTCACDRWFQPEASACLSLQHTCALACWSRAVVPCVSVSSQL